MAQITLLINDNVAVDVRDTLCQYWNMTDFESATNGQKLAFIKAQLAAYIKGIYANRKGAIASEAARQPAVELALQADIT